jgi:UDP-glucuronate 4-epimerase
MKYLITGTAGFIGNAVALRLLEEGNEVLGIDNLNDYYDLRLKLERNKRLEEFSNYEFHELDVCDQHLRTLVASFKPDVFIHLAAQAGVRYSIENPEVYMQSNVQGFFNVLESCRGKVSHLVYASSSSVYGNSSTPFKEDADVTDPVSFYAATKVANEVMAKSYQNIYNLNCTGLRFFTVYGPWGRPDMAVYKFTEKILSGKEIELYNHGNNLRDFTYIDDIVSGIISIVSSPPRRNVYNIGNSSMVRVSEFVDTLESLIGIKANRKLTGPAAGDVNKTWANIDIIRNDFGFLPSVNMQEGLTSFLDWYYYYNKLVGKK